MADVGSCTDAPLVAATTSTPLASKMCNVCSRHDAIYTCPRCSTRTCSLQCSTGHKTAKNCSGERNKAAYVPMNKFGWGTMMDDYVFLEEVGRRVGDWGHEIVKGGFTIRGSRGMGRGRGSAGPGRGRGRGKGRGGGNTKRDLLKIQFEARDIDMELLPVGMGRRKLNQSHWELKSRTLHLTVEYKIYPPRDPLSPSSQPLDPPYIVLTHRNNANTPLLTLAQEAVQRVSSKKESVAPEWTRSLLLPDPDDPTSFTQPHFVMAAHMDPRAAMLQKSQHRTAYHRFDPSKPLITSLRNTRFVEFPTIEVWPEFGGTVVNMEGAVTELAHDEQPKQKRRKLSAKAGRQAIGGLLGGYGSDSEEVEEQPTSGLALLGGYADSEGDDDAVGVVVDNEDVLDDALADSDEDVEVEIDPAVLLELMRQAQGDERWTENIQGEVDWGASGDEEEPE